MTCLIGHCVSMDVVGLGATERITRPPVQENSTPPATAMAERWRNRRRLTGSGCASPRSSSLGWTRSGMPSSSIKELRYGYPRVVPDRSGVLRLRRLLISVLVCVLAGSLAACDGSEPPPAAAPT